MNKTSLDKLTLTLVIIGALNWLFLGLFKIDLVASLFGGTFSFLSRTIYTIIGLSGLYTISLLFRESVPVKQQ